MSGRMIDLTAIEFESGVSLFTGKGFVTVRATGSDGTVLRGQLSPIEIINHAVAYVQAAEAANHDEAVWRAAKGFGLDDETRGKLLMAIRCERDAIDKENEI